MSTNAPSILPAGTQRFQFGGIDLHEIATDLTDTAPVRFAVHEFDRRDGAQTEPMGRGPRVTRTTLVFVGEDGMALARRFAALLEESPTRLLVHPVWGSYQATCGGFNGASLRPSEQNIYRVPVEFTEANLDNRTIATSQQQGAPALAGAVTETTATARGLMTNSGITSPDDVTTFLDGADSFAADALAAANAASIDATLAAQLAAVVAGAGPAQEALWALGTPEAADVAVQIEIATAQARELGAAVVAVAPAPVAWIVPADLPLMALAGRLYGAQAMARMDQILASNPALVGLDVVPAGMQLRVIPV